MSGMHWSVYVSLMIAITGITVTSHATDPHACIDVSRAGKFVERSITVKLKERTLSPSQLYGYNPATKSISIGMVNGQKESLGIESIEKIVFGHKVLVIQPTVQQGYFEILVTASEPLLIEIPFPDLKIENEYVGDRNMSECFIQNRVPFKPREQASVYEVKEIQFDPSAGKIIIQGELVQYKVKSDTVDTNGIPPLFPGTSKY